MKILISDNSAVVRAIIEQNLKKKINFEPVQALLGFGGKAFEAAELTQPDLVICDKDNAVKISSKLKIPVIALISQEQEAKAEEELGFPSSDFILKPGVKDYSEAFFESLFGKIKNLFPNETFEHANSAADISKLEMLPIVEEEVEEVEEPAFIPKTISAGFSPKILCIGASTGGPAAVREVLSGLGTNFPLPVIYTQHVDIGADQKMADWLGESCPNIKVKLAENGEEALPGTVYMAPADVHLIIKDTSTTGKPVLELSNEPPERFLRPAVNKMFSSAAKIYSSSCLAILLTGMGRDGANGCKEIIDAGGVTICEDKSTCVVFGMPSAAIEVGGATEVLPRTKIAPRILNLIHS